MPLLGAGIAGMISSIAFGLYPFDPSISLSELDLLDTSMLLGLTFTAVLILGYSPRPRDGGIQRDSRSSPERSLSRTCPRCGRMVTGSKVFCPLCGANMHNARPAWHAR